MGTFAGQATVRITTPLGGEAHSARASTGTADPGADVVVPSSDQTFELAAGASIVVHSAIHLRTPAATPTAGDIKLWVEFLDDNTAAGIGTGALLSVNTITQAAPLTLGALYAGTDVTFFATSDGTSTGTPKAGTFRIRVRMEYAQVTADATNGGYRVDSDANITLTGTPNTWTSPPAVADKGYLRAGVALAPIGINPAGTTGAPPATWGWQDKVRLNATASVGVLASETAATVAVRTAAAATPGTAVRTETITVGSGTTWADAAGMGFLDKTDPASFVVVLGAPSNSALSGRPFTHFTSAPAGWTLGAVDGGSTSTGAVSVASATQTLDATVYFDSLMQLNDNVFGTPPLSKNITPHQRLATDLGFFAFRCKDTRGNLSNTPAISWTESLSDIKGLVSPKTRNVAAQATQGGEAGWSDAFLIADATTNLPGGSWTHKAVISAPAGLVGQESGNVDVYPVLSPDPAVTLMAYIGASTAAGEADHMHAGDTMVLSFTLMRTDTQRRIAPDAGSATVSLIRYNVSNDHFEFLATDLVTWTDWASGVAAADIALTQDPSDSLRFSLTLSATSGWGSFDLLAALVQAKVNLTPYGFYVARELVDKRNAHSGNAYDLKIGPLVPRS
ncbi:MAG: hypothetical protein ACYDAD_11165 [Acidimicrobiales bacterium]